MIVIVNESSSFNGHGSTTSVTGTSEDGTKRIRFGGDWRAIEGLYQAVQEQGEVYAEVESWQVLGVSAL